MITFILRTSQFKSKNLSFDIDKNWGIVGRLNDFEDYLEWKPKLVEIHNLESLTQLIWRT